MQLKAMHNTFLQELAAVYEPHEASVITDMTFEEIAQATKSILILNPQLELTAGIVDHLQVALEQLKRHKPVQYVLGKAWFYNLPFYVTPAVLIPRPETEELVQCVLQFVMAERNVSVLDIGTGSGCIAISIKKNAPYASVTGIDLSIEALAIARQNAETHATDIQFKQLNFLEELSWPALVRYDVIVSNPPYIPLDEKNKLDKNVTMYEPAAALFVPDNDPLLFYKKIAAFAETRLEDRGRIFMEVHEDYARDVKGHFCFHNYDAEILKDFYGKERMVVATRCR